jgi:hypothetical protein
LSVASSAPGSPLTVGLSGTGVTSTTNLALNQPVTASSSTSSSFSPQMAVDGNTSTYWESTDGAGYPQTITVDLGSVQSIGSVTLDLPPSSAWATRTQTLSVLGSTNGTSFSQIAASAGYTFNPATGNTVTISLPSGTSARYVQLSFTANTGWSAAQLSEFEVFPGGGSGGGPAALTASPSSVSFGSVTVGQSSGAQTVTVSNPGSTSASISQLAVSGPFTQTNTCGTALAAGGSCTVSVSFVPTAAGTASGSLTVASNAPSSPLSVPLSGTGVSSSSGEGPYGGTAAAVPGTVQAANYDTGGQGVAYNVSSVNGTGNSYRSDGVDLEACTDTGSPGCGDDLGWTAAGQWFKYTVNVATAGTYTVGLRLSSPSGVTDGLHLAGSSGANLSGNINVPATGGWQTWTTVSATVTLPAGQQVLTLDEDNGGWNIRYLTFAASSGSPVNLALNQPVTASGYNQTYVPGNAVDGNTSSYWESVDNAFPQWFQVDLGSAVSVSRIVMDLPPSSAWGTRTQTITIQGSTDGTTYTTLAPSTGYTFTSPANTVTVTFPAGTVRYLKLTFTANTGWPAGQLSELQAYAS